MIKNTINRKMDICIGGTFFSLPYFFPSISTIKTNLSPLEYLKILTALKHPLFLISAYDLYHCNAKQLKVIKRLLEDAVNNKRIVLIDSGNYESYWKNDKTWSIEKYREILKSIPHQIAFCYDVFKWNIDLQEIINNIEDEVVKSQSFSHGTIIPVLHSQKKLFPETIAKLADRLNPLIIAIPERELGDGMLERATNVFKIRKELNKKLQYCPLHLLGTGNPLSILIYSICGADSFDGLEWCQATINYDTGLLYHFQQREFFKLDQKFQEISGLPYTQLTLVYNLMFYNMWMNKINKGFLNNNIMEIVDSYLPNQMVSLLKKKLPGVFK
jgi:queuine/archaeosine tRNA-ribosyltransferase